MTTRSHELVIIPGKKSRLTVTPTRVTVKVSQDDEELAGVLSAAGQKIAERIDIDRSLRGCFSIANKRITLRSNSGHLKVAYNFDGEELH